jgi:hypothetical protein
MVLAKKAGAGMLATAGPQHVIPYRHTRATAALCAAILALPMTRGKPVTRRGSA